MGRKIILGDGTELPGVEAGYSSGVLWLYRLGMSITQAIELLTEARTRNISFVYGGIRDEYEGFTRIAAAYIDFDGTVKVALTQPVE